MHSGATVSAYSNPPKRNCRRHQRMTAIFGGSFLVMLLMGCGSSELPIVVDRNTGDWQKDISQLYIPSEVARNFLTEDEAEVMQRGGNRSSGAVVWVLVLLVLAGIAFYAFLAYRDQYEQENAITCFVIFMAIIILVLIIIGTAIWRSVDSSNHARQLDQLASMWLDVDRFNKTLGNMHVVDRLQAAGNPVEVGSRAEVIKQLSETKKQLLRAIETYAILRDNPDFEWGMNEITSLVDNRAVREIENRAGDLAEAYSNALEIEMNARKMLSSLRERD